MKRVVIPELLDSDAGTSSEVQKSLADLRSFNRWFGGIATTCYLVQRVAEETHVSRLSLLEVAAGSGYVAEAAARRLQQRGLTLQFTLLDRSLAHLKNGSATHAGQRVVGDALALPFRDQSFDIVGCGLFAHHLEPDEVEEFVNEGLRVAKIAVVINDLVRDPLHLAAVYAGVPVYRSRITRHDAPVSVRRAYTQEEILDILGRTRASRVEFSRHYFFRMGVVAWK